MGKTGGMQRQVNGYGMWVEDKGEGIPLVLLHAFPLDHHVWKEPRALLAEDYRVILLDFRGFGRSTSTPPPYTMDLLAEDVHALLDELGISRAVIGGISMGGYVALTFTNHYPEAVLGLALVDTRATADTDEAREGRTRMAETARLKGPAVVVEEMLPKFFSPATAENRPDLISRVRELGAQASVDGLAGALAAMRDREDSRPLLPRITVPTLVLVGEEDTLTPVADAEAMAAEIPEAMLRVVPGAGHLSPFEQPQAATEALRELMARVRA